MAKGGDLAKTAIWREFSEHVVPHAMVHVLMEKPVLILTPLSASVHDVMQQRIPALYPNKKM